MHTTFLKVFVVVCLNYFFQKGGDKFTKSDSKDTNNVTKISISNKCHLFGPSSDERIIEHQNQYIRKI